MATSHSITEADDSVDSGEWALEGVWTSITAALVRRRRRPTITQGWDVDVQVALDAPYPGGYGGTAVLYLDIAFVLHPSSTQVAGLPQVGGQAAELPPPYRFTLPALYGFADTLLGAAADDIGANVFPILLGTDDWTRNEGPRISVESAQGSDLSEFIVFGSHPRAREARDQNQTDFYAARADDVSDAEVRRGLLVEWLELLYLNQGYYDFDSVLEPLGRS